MSVLKHYLNFSLPIVPGILSGWIINLSDRYIIGYFLGVSLVGIYSAAYSIGGIVAIFMGPIDTILFPTISELYRNNRFEELKRYLKYSLKFYLMLAIPSLFGLAVLSKSLLITLATSDFLYAFFIIPIVAFGTVVYAGGGIFSSILILSKKTKIVGLVSGISALINIILNIIFIPIIGIVGAAIATLITFFFEATVNGILGFREIHFGIDLRFIAKSVISSILMAFVVWKLNPYGAVAILTSILIGSLIYFGILVLLKGFTKEEYVFFRGLFRN
jgi:O-antigen/teichoic acid export membrane protein